MLKVDLGVTEVLHDLEKNGDIPWKKELDRKGCKSEEEAIAWRRMVDENIERIFDMPSAYDVTRF